MDTVIKNCKILTYSDDKTKVVDIYLKDGYINKISRTSDDNLKNIETIDANGEFVFPGLIDFHTHLFKSGSAFGLDADRLFEAGSTTVVDMGTAGYINYDAFHECDIKNKDIRIRTFLNYSPVGQLGGGIYEPLDNSIIDLPKLYYMVEKYPDEIVGIKIRYSKEIVGELGTEPLKNALKVCEKLGLPLCVHATGNSISNNELLELLRPGDIYSHVYHNKGNTIIENNVVSSSVIDAKKRGVIFDVGNGKSNFSFDIAETSLNNGFYPNIISSDSTESTFHNNRIMWDLPYVASKFLSLGMTLEEVIIAMTIEPAKVLGISDEIGLIKEGYIADLVICDLVSEHAVFTDVDGKFKYGNKLITPSITIKGGKVVFKNNSAHKGTEL